ncbi:hypothetical protein BDN72DRAFT_847979 [Pluteus cervinus]|uniref:Uncharacterized protein n=1 Tax=Pluteus cervinus TaxID=181527 RepID=A0ACD3AC27_9AGAR|nr:hypothetical protein BDN72DRAFT_847979 [Pluteus cervinus]
MENMMAIVTDGPASEGSENPLAPATLLKTEGTSSQAASDLTVGVALRTTSKPDVAEIIARATPPVLLPLYNPNRSSPDYYPFLVFGFVITREKLLEWADKYNCLPGEPPFTRSMRAWEERVYKAPGGWPRTGTVYDREGLIQRCILIGSNKSEKALRASQNLKKIWKFYDWYGRDINPGWYRLDSDA